MKNQPIHMSWEAFGCSFFTFAYAKTAEDAKLKVKHIRDQAPLNMGPHRDLPLTLWAFHRA